MKVRYLNRITEEINEYKNATRLYETMDRVLQYEDEDGVWHDVLDDYKPFGAWLIERKEKFLNGKQAYLSSHISNFHDGKAVFHWTDLPDHALTFKTEESANTMMKYYKKTSWEEWPECYVADHLFNCGTMPE